MEERFVEVDGARLAVSRSPGVGLELIALQGSVPGTRDGALYRHLHRVLPPVGIGVVTFDRRGEGESSGSPSRGDFDRQANDCNAIMDALDVAVMGIWGFSQGAWIAPMVASTRPGVACVVTVGASGVSPFQQMRYGVARHLRDAGYGGDVLDRVDALWVAAMEALRDGGDKLEAIAGELKAASSEPWWPLAFLPDSVPDGPARAAMLRQMEHDPLPTFRAIPCPVLAFYGEQDEWVPVEPSVQAWAAAQGRGATTVVLRGGGHDPLDSTPEVAQEYERRLVAWLSGLATHTAGRGSGA